MFRCLLIPVDGPPTLHMISGLTDMYPLIENCDTVQCVYLNVPASDALPMWLDDEGKCTRKLRNVRACELCRDFDTGLMPSDFIVGNVLVSGPLDDDGYATSITDEAVFRLCRQVKAIVPSLPEPS